MWLVLSVKVPVWVVSGKVDMLGVSAVAKRIHQQLPRSQYVLWDSCNHFGPMETPSKLSDLIEEVALQLDLKQTA